MKSSYMSHKSNVLGYQSPGLNLSHISSSGKDDKFDRFEFDEDLFKKEVVNSKKKYY